MKKQKFILPILIFTLAIFFIACTNDNVPEISSTPNEIEKPSISIPKVESEPESPPEQLPDDNLIYTDGLYIGYPEEVTLANYEIIHTEIMYPDGGEMVFISQKNLSDFCFIKIKHDINGDEIILSEGEIIFELREWNSKEAIAVTTYVAGSIPDIGITFTDENGVRRYYYIVLSGMDGSLSLEEFENGKKLF